MGTRTPPCSTLLSIGSSRCGCDYRVCKGTEKQEVGQTENGLNGTRAGDRVGSGEAGAARSARSETGIDLASSAEDVLISRCPRGPPGATRVSILLLRRRMS